jgi:hypothetical protein
VLVRIVVIQARLDALESQVATAPVVRGTRCSHEVSPERSDLEAALAKLGASVRSACLVTAHDLLVRCRSVLCTAYQDTSDDRSKPERQRSIERLVRDIDAALSDGAT